MGSGFFVKEKSVWNDELSSWYERYFLFARIFIDIGMNNEKAKHYKRKLNGNLLLERDCDDISQRDNKKDGERE